MIVPLSEPDITRLEIDTVTAVLKSTRLSLGPCAEKFEALLAAHVGVPHGVAVSSGTAALHLCLLALHIGRGDEVIVPSFAFIAVANAVRYVGAIPVFVDIDPASLNINPFQIEAALTVRTQAIIVVHTFGLPVAMQPITWIASKHGLRVIEDACEALGATCDGRQAGSFGDLAVFAFYPNKQITTGEGGMVVTRDDKLALQVRAMRNQGRVPCDQWHQHSIFGYNYHMSELNAALGAAQMQRLPSILLKRNAAAARYAALFAGEGRVDLPLPEHQGCRSSWFAYVVRVSAAVRDDALQRLATFGVQCGRYFAPIHQQLPYADRPILHPLPATTTESRRTLALPFFNRLTTAQATYVAERLRLVLDEVEPRS